MNSTHQRLSTSIFVIYSLAIFFSPFFAEIEKVRRSDEVLSVGSPFSLTFYKAFFIKIVMEFLMEIFSARCSLKYACFFESCVDFHRTVLRIAEDIFVPSKLLCAVGKRQNGSEFRRSVALAGMPIQKRVYSVLRPRIGEHVRSRARVFTYAAKLEKYASVGIILF